jgi:hypothetical protein
MLKNQDYILNYIKVESDKLIDDSFGSDCFLVVGIRKTDVCILNSYDNLVQLMLRRKLFVSFFRPPKCRLIRIMQKGGGNCCKISF